MVQHKAIIKKVCLDSGKKRMVNEDVRTLSCLTNFILIFI